MSLMQKSLPKIVVSEVCQQILFDENQFRAEFFNLSTNDILDQNILCHGGWGGQCAVLCTVRCLATSLFSNYQMPVAIPFAPPPFSPHRQLPSPHLIVTTTKNVFQFSSVTQSCPTLCNPMNCSTPGLPVRYQLPEFSQTHVHRVGDAIQPSHPLSSPSPPAPNPSQHQSLFQCVNSSLEVAKLLEFQL